MPPEEPDESPWLVLKFGGTSVATAERWRRIAIAVKRSRDAGHRPLVVCSAVAGTTDALVRIAATLDAGADPTTELDAISATHARLAADLGLDGATLLAPDLAGLSRLASEGGPVDPARRARLLAHGELMSTRLGAAWLARLGFNTRWADARDLLQADAPPPGATPADAYLAARAGTDPDDELSADLARGGPDAVITQGFLARNDRGETVLLGRGGSDTSAACLAARLRARGLEIWTDVPGLFTADPRHLPSARLIRGLDHHEAEVFGAMGARVLHPRCLQPAREHGIPVRIGWTDRPDVQGTVIGAAHHPLARTDAGVKGVASRDGLCLVTVNRDPEWQPVGFMAAVASVFLRRGLSMDLIASSPAAIRVTLEPAAFPGAEASLDDLLRDLRGLSTHVEAQTGLACVSLVGTDVSRDAPHLGAALDRLDVPVHMTAHAGDDTHLSYVVAADAAAPLTSALHGALLTRLGHGPRRAFGPSWTDLARPPRRATVAASA